MTTPRTVGGGIKSDGVEEYFFKTVEEDVAVGADSSHECHCSSFPQLKEYWQRKSPGVPAGANRKKKINGSSPDTAASGGYRSPGDVSLGWPGSWGQGTQGQ